jgi:hypothetical protein
MGQTAYRQLWGIVSGAVTDAFNRHPDYLTPKGKRSASKSIVKRVTGTVLSFAVQETARSRGQAADMGEGAFVSSAPEADGDVSVIRTHSYAHVNERCYQAIRRALFPVGRREVRKDAKRFKSALKDTTKRLRRELKPTETPEQYFARMEPTLFAGMRVSRDGLGKA